MQVSRSFYRAAVFNLSKAELRRQVLEPWARGGPVELGDREWDPAKSDMVVLEGPSLAAPELALGQGWNNASRGAQDVTAEILEPAQRTATAVAVLAEPSSRAAIAALLEDLGLEAVDWGAVRARLLASTTLAEGAVSADLGVAAVVVVLDGQRPFDVGLALGALRDRGIPVRLGRGPVPPEVAELQAIRLDAAGRTPLHLLAERLRLSGCDVRPAPGWDEPDRFSDG